MIPIRFLRFRFVRFLMWTVPAVLCCGAAFVLSAWRVSPPHDAFAAADAVNAINEMRPSLQDSLKPAKPKPIAETLQPYLFPVQWLTLSKPKRMEIAYVDVSGADSSQTSNTQTKQNAPAAEERSGRGGKNSTKSGGKSNRKSSRAESRSSRSAKNQLVDERETILFLHGLNGYIPIWNKQIQELRTKYRCIALDLPGFGRSDKSQQYTLSIFAYADAVVKFMDALKLQRVTLVGHSMGGQIALNIATRYAKRVSRVVLVSSTGLEPFSEQERQAFHENVTENTTKMKTDDQIRSDYNRLFFKTPADAEFLLKDRLSIKYSTDFDEYCYAVKQSILGVVDMPTYDMLEGLNQNVLMLFGQNDNYIPNPFFHAGQRAAEIGEFGKQRLRHSKLQIIPQCGHFVQFEKPDVVNKAIAEFIASSF
jgi:pimeloyl-ACP methyl ester carboxylesterase